MIAASLLIDEARTWLGVPFRHQGRSRLGVDCAGFIVALMRSVGELPADFIDVTNYARRPSGELLMLVKSHCTRARIPVPGLLVLMRWRKEQQPSHVAVLVGDTLIHCYERHGEVVEHAYRGPWRRDTHSLWMLPGVSYE